MPALQPSSSGGGVEIYRPHRKRSIMRELGTPPPKRQPSAATRLPPRTTIPQSYPTSSGRATLQRRDMPGSVLRSTAARSWEGNKSQQGFLEATGNALFGLGKVGAEIGKAVYGDPRNPVDIGAALIPFGAGKLLLKSGRILQRLGRGEKYINYHGSMHDVTWDPFPGSGDDPDWYQTYNLLGEEGTSPFGSINLSAVPHHDVIDRPSINVGSLWMRPDVRKTLGAGGLEDLTLPAMHEARTSGKPILADFGNPVLEAAAIRKAQREGVELIPERAANMWRKWKGNRDPFGFAPNPTTFDEFMEQVYIPYTRQNRQTSLIAERAVPGINDPANYVQGGRFYEGGQAAAARAARRRRQR